MRMHCLRAPLGLTLLLLLGCGEVEREPLEGRPAGPQRMTLAVTPLRPQPGEDSLLTWQLRDTTSGKPVTDLAVLHERVIHNFIVNRDFSSFAHIHHEDFRPLAAADLAQARFSLPYRFPRAGHYRIVSEYTHRGRGRVKHFDLTVGDPPERPRALPPVRLVQDSADYHGRLQLSPARPVAGFETELVLELVQGGAAVTDLALSLGSEAHVAVWRDDGSDFGHTHSFTPHMAEMLAAMHGAGGDPATRARRLVEMMTQMMNMPSELVYPGPRIPLRYVFPSPGRYHVFIQCAPGGVARVFDFVVDVVAHAEGMDTRVDSMVPAGHQP